MAKEAIEQVITGKNGRSNGHGRNLAGTVFLGLPFVEVSFEETDSGHYYPDAFLSTVTAETINDALPTAQRVRSARRQLAQDEPASVSGRYESAARTIPRDQNPFSPNTWTFWLYDKEYLEKAAEDPRKGEEVIIKYCGTVPELFKPIPLYASPQRQAKDSASFDAAVANLEMTQSDHSLSIQTPMFPNQ